MSGVEAYLKADAQDTSRWVTAFLPEGKKRYGRICNTPGESVHNMMKALRLMGPTALVDGFMKIVRDLFVSRGLDISHRQAKFISLCGDDGVYGVVDVAQKHQRECMEVRDHARDRGLMSASGAKCIIRLSADRSMLDHLCAHIVCVHVCS